MEILDKVFEIVFARFRREMGDANLEAAWRRASLRVSAYVGWPIGAALIVLMAVFFSFVAVGAPPEHKRWIQMLGGAIGVLTSIVLDRRFTKYLVAPPSLSAEESRTDARLVFRFRFICYSVVLLTGVVGFLLHESGATVLQGF
jgi:hypothetical protein